jgi:hypothetical protein
LASNDRCCVENRFVGDVEQHDRTAVAPAAGL